MSRTGIAQHQVYRAASALRDRGIKPTTKAIREYLGTGSLTTISKYMKEWRGHDVIDADERPLKGISTISAIKGAEPRDLAMILSKEHPQVIALILAHMDAQNSAEVLALIPQDRQSDIIDRLAHLQGVEPEILERISRALEQSMKNFEKARQIKGGAKFASEVLVNLEERMRSKSISKIEQKDQKNRGGH